jgi:hypothetical protein
MRHILNHMEEIATQQFAELERISPQTAARARAHVADHFTAVEAKQMAQEDQLMQMQQIGTSMGLLKSGAGGGGQPSPVGGAAGPGQGPGSPKVRNNETERGESGMSREANAGAQ